MTARKISTAFVLKVAVILVGNWAEVERYPF